MVEVKQADEQKQKQEPGSPVDEEVEQAHELPRKIEGAGHVRDGGVEAHHLKVHMLTMK